jgi:hypothetical protein
MPAAHRHGFLRTSITIPPIQGGAEQAGALEVAGHGHLRVETDLALGRPGCGRFSPSRSRRPRRRARRGAGWRSGSVRGEFAGRKAGGGQRGRVEAGMFKLKDRGSSSRLRAGGECQEGGRRRAAAVWRWHRAGCTTGGRTAAGVPMLENQQLIPIDAANSASAGQWPVSETPLVAGWVLAALPRRKMAYQRWFGI